MGAPKGNQYWRQRFDMTKDGRKLSVEDFEKKIDEYITRCTTETLDSPDWVGKDAVQVSRPHMIVMSIWGVCAHLGIDTNTWKEWRKDKKYSHIITQAEHIFKAYNIEGASANMLNQSIIARLESLTENVDVTTGGEKISTTIIVQDQATKKNLDKLIENEGK